MRDLIPVVFGAALGVGFDRLFLFIQKVVKRCNPLEIVVSRVESPPAWYITDKEVPIPRDKSTSFNDEVCANSPFCGFAKVRVSIANKASETVYLNDIRVQKKGTKITARTRVRTVPQGGAPAVRLFSFLDSDRPLLYKNLLDCDGIAKPCFSDDYRVVIDPGKNEIINLVFVTLENDWEFNISLDYEIAGKKRSINNIFEKDMELVAYRPNELEDDYCLFMEKVAPGYPLFEDSKYFTDEMRGRKIAMNYGEPMSSLEYIQRLTSV